MVLDVRDPYALLERKLAGRLRDDESHRRVSRALAEVATAAIYPARSLSGARAVTGLLEDPVESAARVAVETLIDELDDLIDGLPAEALDQLFTEQRLGELGVE
jgi:hypothetical protein